MFKENFDHKLLKSRIHTKIERKHYHLLLVLFVSCCVVQTLTASQHSFDRQYHVPRKHKYVGCTCENLSK